MLENITIAELIDDYLSGRLNQEEKTAFEKRLSTETALAEQVALHKKITAGIQASSRANLLSMLKEEDAKMPAYQPDVEAKEAKTIAFNPARKQIFYWAAAVILLLLVPVFIVMRNNTSGDEVFTQHFKPFQNQEVPVTGDSADLHTKAMQHYEKQNYALALPILEKMLGTTTGTDTAEAEVQFYKGNSHLALNHPKEAINCFEAVLAMPDNQYTEEAKWYLALSYIKADDKKKARQVLKEIVANESHPYYKEAQEILKKL